MTDTTAAGQELMAAPAQALRTRDYRVVESRLGIMDTARFEHLGRVATVLAKAGLLPESLTHVGPKDKREALPYETIQARAFLIANQADLLEIDPNALAQCTSFVHGRLMYEGKLVHALISAKLGIDLEYLFGTYDYSKRDIIGSFVKDGSGNEIWQGLMPDKPDDQALGVRVVGTLPGETASRSIAGSVAMWHKGAQSPWGNQNAWPRQLRYMGAREWARAYKPSLMLGILADDEVDEYELGRQVGQIGQAAPQLLSSGFTDVRTATLQALPAESKAKKRVAKPDDAPAASEKVPPAAEAAKTGPTTPEAENVASTTTAAATSATDDDLPASLRGLPQEPEGDTIAEGYPEAGEVYYLTGDGWNEQGRRETYKDGAPFSTSAKRDIKVYEDHPPEGPGGDTAETTASDQTDEGDDDDDSGFPPEFSTYIQEVEDAKSWVEVKKAMQVFYNTPIFKEMTGEHQNKVRANTWDSCVDAKIADLPDQAADASAFRLWTESCTDPDAILGTLRALEAFPAYAAKDPAFRDVIRGAAEKRIADLQA